MPLIADIHFSPARAIEAIEGGAAKIRLNPGNIKSREDIHRIIDAAKAHEVAIRIGVNEASIRDLTKEPVPPEERVDLMLAEMRQYVQLFEDRGFDRLVLSAKTSDTMRTIEVNRRIAETFRYPLHLGLTHAGLPEDARIPSAIALGTLLAEGIGDTIRVSAAGDPGDRDADGRGDPDLAGTARASQARADRLPHVRTHRDRRGQAGPAGRGGPARRSTSPVAWR